MVVNMQSLPLALPQQKNPTSKRDERKPESCLRQHFSSPTVRSNLLSGILPMRHSGSCNRFHPCSDHTSLVPSRPSKLLPYVHVLPPPLASCNDTPRSFGSTARPFISSHVVVFVEIVYRPSNVFLTPFPPPTLVRGTLFLFGIRRLRGGCCLAGVGVGLRALGRH